LLTTEVRALRSYGYGTGGDEEGGIRVWKDAAE
jgi:hypothetical protein